MVHHFNELSDDVINEALKELTSDGQDQEVDFALRAVRAAGHHAQPISGNPDCIRVMRLDEHSEPVSGQWEQILLDFHQEWIDGHQVPRDYYEMLGMGDA